MAPYTACAVIVAGGSGSRFGDPRGKQYVDLCGQPLLAWALQAFDATPAVTQLVVVVPAGQEAHTLRDVVEPCALATPLICVAGGATRQASVRAGLAVVPPACELVAIHDGARPLVTPSAIQAALEACARGADCALLAAPVADTLKRADDQGFVAQTVDRAQLWAAQTPQVMRAELARALHERAVADGLDVTDDAALAEAYGYRVQVVDPRGANFKVTVPDDLPLAAAVLQARALRASAAAQATPSP